MKYPPIDKSAAAGMSAADAHRGFERHDLDDSMRADDEPQYGNARARAESEAWRKRYGDVDHPLGQVAVPPPDQE